MRIRPDLTAFFGCLYYGALRPEEATALRLADCHLPASGWGILTLTRATPRTAAAWTSNGKRQSSAPDDQEKRPRRLPAPAEDP
jgi:hypothetical protein